MVSRSKNDFNILDHFSDVKLTTKQAKWLQALVETQSLTEAAYQVYNCKDRKIAATISSQNLKKLNIPIGCVMDAMGLSLGKTLSKLNNLMDAKKVQYFANKDGVVCDERVDDDGVLQLQATRTALSLRGLPRKDKDSEDKNIAVYQQFVTLITQASTDKKSKMKTIDAQDGTVVVEEGGLEVIE